MECTLAHYLDTISFPLFMYLVSEWYGHQTHYTNTQALCCYVYKLSLCTLPPPSPPPTSLIYIWQQGWYIPTWSWGGGGEREEKVQGGVISISSPTEGNECLICGLWNAKWFTGDQQAVDGWLVLPLRQVSAMWLTFVSIIVHNRIRQCNNAALLLSFGSYRHGNKFVFPCYCGKFIGVYISQLMRTGRLDRETGY